MVNDNNGESCFGHLWMHLRLFWIWKNKGLFDNAVLQHNQTGLKIFFFIIYVIVVYEWILGKYYSCILDLEKITNKNNFSSSSLHYKKLV